MFRTCSPAPGVTHITDAMGVSFTLIEGNDSALLFDAGYGLEDVASFVRTLTEKPVELILSHGHHDHVLGARWFSRCRMDEADLEEYRLRTDIPQRRAVLGQAAGNGLSAPENFLDAPVPEPEGIPYTDTLGEFACCGFDLGNREVWLIRVPGHTAGSVVLYVPEYRLLLTGDDWNPCTWMWFPCSLPVRRWHANMSMLVALLEKAAGQEIRQILCSHQSAPREGAELKSFLSYMTEERLRAAPPVNMQSPINTHQVTEPEKGWVLLFDADKK